jgi:DNA-directed RNA polymerase specialized sigma24 family protein
MLTDDAVTVWLGQLRAGESIAARRLWETYFHRMVGLARTRLRNSAHRITDEEDVALSAFNSFCINAEAGRFPDLTDHDSLWRLLATFTLRKAARHMRDACAQRRGGGKIESVDSEVFEQVLGHDPDPALAVEMAEECKRLLAVLDSDKLRQIAILRMEGYSVDEIASKTPYAPRSVKRKLGIIREIWKREAGHESV